MKALHLSVVPLQTDPLFHHAPHHFRPRWEIGFSFTYVVDLLHELSGQPNGDRLRIKRLDPSGFNTAVLGCDSEAADAHAEADKLIWKF
ncbi:hypothetical protein SAMN05444339_10524 [Loktanella atrilutea]|uniref:Uncharacterized protein n=1 Tax=Loktanella atrilutea TaxID=366533 RepID=A0A1M5AM63_LOKAT|nr:hypothetical protein [Loktanella atrilutea]SHF31361.1 hypothetical protein SAMN05444339_10524 [Loktanella atrilutea]